MMKHNIYLIEASDGANITYDCFDAHVVVADNPKEARRFCSCADEGEATWLDKTYSTVKKIGESNKKKGEVLSSFNAG